MFREGRSLVMGMVLFLSAITLCEAETVHEGLIGETIKSAEALVLLSSDAKVSYKASTKHVKIAFTTPSDYKRDFSDFFHRWRHNQWVVLQEFKRSKIPVRTVTIETNYVDSGTIMRHTHSAAHVDKYAKLPSDDLWLKAAKSYQRNTGSEKWKKLYYD